MRGSFNRGCSTLLSHPPFTSCVCVFSCRLKSFGCENLDDLSQFDSQLQLPLAAWGYYYEDYIRLSTGIKILQTTRGTRGQDYEIQLVHSLAERRLNEKWSLGEYPITFLLIVEEIVILNALCNCSGYTGQFISIFNPLIT